MMNINNVDTSRWESCSLRSIVSKMQEAKHTNKWLFIWDKIGTVATYFRYQARLCDYGREIHLAKRGAKSHEQALEVFRDAIISAQRSGGQLLIDLEDECPDFTEQSRYGVLNGQRVFQNGTLPGSLST
mmetsp:Transcript_15170/g.19207  ORF Transcript_15170/g.19207 Transcript_15170/m.19207 type:complete len:129 (-) Transcript_15170:235-621(-)|eukprot:CAMPEP_0170466140 /NCGR_PEP_ID=MMETSP0123-20130129/10216_1 /TAXON_ID=182087 /ORGANISM="Favella ehrenbergii, Strain Fehren 1" /LENGTH=128 /DNA_ID=CAMNT_0010732203 /DNA_START=33 /DNA_END=419 /DNA_ORIENTATION=+